MNEPQHLGRKAYIVLSFKKSVPGIVILALGSAFLYSGWLAKLLLPAAVVDDIVIGTFLLALVALLMGLLTARVEYMKQTFTFEEFGMRLDRGRMKIIEVTIPYRQMQDINIERGVLHQLTGTSKIIINTAGDERQDEKNETDIVLDPVSKDIAEEIRLILMRKIGVQVVEGEGDADREFARAASDPTSTRL